MRHKNLERRDEVREGGLGDGLVGLAFLPGVVGFDIIDEDQEVIRRALVVDLVLLSGAPHFDCCFVCVGNGME